MTDSVDPTAHAERIERLAIISLRSHWEDEGIPDAATRIPNQRVIDNECRALRKVIAAYDALAAAPGLVPLPEKMPFEFIKDLNLMFTSPSVAARIVEAWNKFRGHFGTPSPLAAQTETMRRISEWLSVGMQTLHDSREVPDWMVGIATAVSGVNSAQSHDQAIVKAAEASWAAIRVMRQYEKDHPDWNKEDGLNVEWHLLADDALDASKAEEAAIDAKRDAQSPPQPNASPCSDCGALLVEGQTAFHREGCSFAQTPPPRGERERIERSGKDRRIDTNERLELGLGIGPGARNRTMERTCDIDLERAGKDRRAQPQSGEPVDRLIKELPDCLYFEHSGKVCVSKEDLLAILRLNNLRIVSDGGG